MITTYDIPMTLIIKEKNSQSYYLHEWYILTLLYCSLPLFIGCFCLLTQIRKNFLYSIFTSVRLEQGTMTSLLEDSGTIQGVQYKTKTGEQFKAYAPLTIVCDGCFSNLRRSLCSPKVQHEITEN